MVKKEEARRMALVLSITGANCMEALRPLTTADNATQNCRFHAELGNKRFFETAYATPWHFKQPLPMPPRYRKRLAGKEARVVHRTVPPQPPCACLLINSWTTCSSRLATFPVLVLLAALFFRVAGMQKAMTRDKPRRRFCVPFGVAEHFSRCSA